METLPTLARVLELDAVRRGRPVVVACADRLDAPVRWVHSIELADAARLLRGGELVLTTGIALGDDPAALAEYVAGLAEVGAAGLAVELGRRYTGGLPAALVAAAAERGLPLIAFEREVPFVEITEAVHARIIDAQHEQLRESARLHEVFTDLAVTGAAPDEIVRQAALLSGRPVILADLAGHVLAWEPAGADPSRLLDEFEARSRADGAAAWARAWTGAGGRGPADARPGPDAGLPGAGGGLPGAGGGLADRPGQARTWFDAAAGWLGSAVGARGEDWGQVIVALGREPGPTDYLLVERAATTIALSRLAASQQQNLQRQAHASLIGAIIARGDADQAALRARALGLPVAGRRLIGLVLRFRSGWTGLPAQALVLEAADAVAGACHGERVPALVGALDEARAAAVLSLPPRADPDRVLEAVCEQASTRFGRRARRFPGLVISDPVIGAGSAAASIRELHRSLLEAIQVADAVAQAPEGTAPPLAATAATRPHGGWPYYHLADLRLRGLLYLLGDDPRLATFVDRELGPLLVHDAEHGTALVGLLTAYLAAGGNKAAAATAAHLARPTLYERLKQIERILGVSLDSPESLACLQVALLAHSQSR